MSGFSRRARRRGIAAVALAVPLTLAMSVGAAAAEPQAAGTDRAATAVTGKGHGNGSGHGNGNGNGHGNEGNHGKPPVLEATVKSLIKVKGRHFKDLNANGKLDVYEDWRKPVEDRVANLVDQMTLEEKAGLMLIDTLNAACDPASGEFGTVPSSPTTSSANSRCTASSSATSWPPETAGLASRPAGDSRRTSWSPPQRPRSS